MSISHPHHYGGTCRRPLRLSVCTGPRHHRWLPLSPATSPGGAAEDPDNPAATVEPLSVLAKVHSCQSREIKDTRWWHQPLYLGRGKASPWPWLTRVLGVGLPLLPAGSWPSSLSEGLESHSPHSIISDKQGASRRREPFTRHTPREPPCMASREGTAYEHSWDIVWTQCLVRGNVFL